MSNTRKFSSPVRVGQSAADPSETDAGTIYYNSTDDVLKFRKAASYVPVLGEVVEDTTPQLGGDLDVLDKKIESSVGEIIVAPANSVRRSKFASPNDFVEEEYIHSVSLLASQTGTDIPELNFDTTIFEACKIDYKMKDSLGEVRAGTMLVATNGTDISFYDGPSVETNPINITFDADIQTLGVTSATGTLATTTSITLTSVATGSARNGETFTLQVAAAAANPTNTILANFTGTSAAIVCTITPNDGTNNGGTPVNLETDELVELINTGSVTGKSVTVTDLSSFRILQTATGGDNTNLADGGEGDGLVATFGGGSDGIVTGIVTYTSGTETAEIRLDVKRIKT